MALGQHLVQKQIQRLVITQDLRQSIELLPLSNLELNDRIQQELLENPLLEEISSDDTQELIPAQSSVEDENSFPIDDQEKFTGSLPKNQDNNDQKHLMLQNTPSLENLEDSLLDQLRLFSLSDQEWKAGELIISDLDHRGFLTMSLIELFSNTNISMDTAVKVRDQISTLDPPGCAAADIQEALYFQARILRPDDTIVHELIQEHFELLEKLDFKQIEKKTGFTIEKIENALKFIKTLEPFPGTLFKSKNSDYIVPDVVIEDVNGVLEVFINDEWIPSLKINSEYSRIMENQKLGEKDQIFFSEKYNSAQWLIKSLIQRRNTLGLVVKSILNRQSDFFIKGTGNLHPMTLKDIADEIEMHESTVSRITTNKYIQTKWGIFELKYFFTSSLKRNDSDENESAKNIQQKIFKLINNESPDHILSDQELVDLMSKEGIQIARRTVAKYRNNMNLLSADRRKKIKNLSK